jgi:uncharacterized protein with GYD domain
MPIARGARAQGNAAHSTELPKLHWLDSYAVLGACDYVDIFKASDIDTANKVSALLRTYGHAQTEIWAATEWAHFKDLVRSIAPVIP